jgi:hypothetical protein
VYSLEALQANFEDPFLEPPTKSDIVYVTGAQMKEQKICHANLSAATNLPNLSLLETCNYVMQSFNLKRVLATSGVANAGHPC